MFDSSHEGKMNAASLGVNVLMVEFLFLFIYLFIYLFILTTI